MADGTSPSQQREDHHDPAGRDWPRGIRETSVWPFLAAVGVATLYVGAGLFALSFGIDAIFPAWPGLVVFLGGFGLFATGLFGWLYHGYVSHYWDKEVDPRERLSLRAAMVLFLGTEVATFGAGFAYYFFIRVRPWPPETLPHLLSSLVLANTVLLVTSSVTLHFAQHALRGGNHGRFEKLLGATVVLGIVFLLAQGYEYVTFVVDEGFTLSSGLFASAFYGLTGLHGLHVTLGVVVLSIVFVRAWKLDQYSADRMTSVSTVSMYWHFVDVVWLFVVATVYLGGALTVP